MVERLTRRRYLRTVGAVGSGVALAGCSAGGSGGGTTVDMTDALTFEPSTLDVSAGDTVTWDNVGTVGHSVTAYEADVPGSAAYFASGGFSSERAAREAYPEGRVVGGATFEHTFEVPGTYPYFCVPHERSGMRGTIEVG